MLRHVSGVRVVADEEALPFALASFDLVISLLNLHWVNDSPGAPLQVRQALKPTVYFSPRCSAETLKELRERSQTRRSRTKAASALASRRSPTCAMPAICCNAPASYCVADVETLTVAYADPSALLIDSRGTRRWRNAVLQRRKTASRATLFRGWSSATPRVASRRR